LMVCSLACCVVGIFLLYTFSKNFTPRELRINEVTKEHLGETIAVSGRIAKVYRSKKGHIFLELEDMGEKLSVVVFSNLARTLPKDVKFRLKEGNWLRVVGKVQEYKGRLEIIPNKPSDLQPI